MKHLAITNEQAKELVKYAREAFPNEACGILLGQTNTLHTIIPARNISTNPLHTYHIEDRTLIQAFQQANQRGISVIGFYHSHPTSDPIPSPTDIRLATYPDLAYVIISLKKPDPELAAWSICNDSVSPITIHVGSNPLEEDVMDLSPAQKGAIISAAIIAMLFVLILSITLLPPAPVIVTPEP
jgi:proteasome lid subunit RPN8/RPN11